MGSSRLCFFISPILIRLVRITIAQPDFLYNECSNSGNYSSNSTYQANLNRLLSSISSDTEIDYGFYNFSAGLNTDQVNAIALCRGDVTPDTCRSCVNDSSHKLTQVCPYQKEAFRWYDYCMLRYSNRSIFGTLESGVPNYSWNSNNASDVVQFNKALGTLLNNLRNQAASGGSLRKFATGEADVTIFQKIYALMQCTPDLSDLQCRTCLDVAIGVIQSSLYGKQDGRVFGPSCNLRYATYSFYESTADAPPPQPSTPPPTTNTTGKESNTSRTVIIIVVATVTSLIVLIVCIYIFLRMRKPREKVETVDEIRTVESLQFDFATIRVATDNFSDANKLGQGGFGAVYK